MSLSGFKPSVYERLGGLYSYLFSEDVPPGFSPALQNVRFRPGSVESRPGLVPQFTVASLAASPAITGFAQYIDDYLNRYTLVLDELGDLSKQNVATTTLLKTPMCMPGSFLSASNANQRIYLASYTGKVEPTGPVWQFDGTNVDPFSPEGPGGSDHGSSTGTLALGSTTITAVTNVEMWLVGDSIAAASGDIPNYARVTAVNYDGKSLEISIAATGNHIADKLFCPIFRALDAHGTGNTTLGSTYITGVTNIEMWRVGDLINNLAGDFPAGTTVTFIQTSVPVLGVSNPSTGTSIANDLLWGGLSASAGTVAAGVHGVAVAFVTRSGYLTEPSSVVYWTAAGGSSVQLSGLPIGPSYVIGRQVLFTVAGGANYYILKKNYVADNTTTVVQLDFSDTELAAGESGDYLFDSYRLPDAAAVSSYNERTLVWGARNQSIVTAAGESASTALGNLGFDGGTYTQRETPTSVNVAVPNGWTLGSATAYVQNLGSNAPDTAADDGGALIPWANPTNALVLDGTTTDAALAASDQTNHLLITFNLAPFTPPPIPVDGVPCGISVSIRRHKSAGAGTVRDLTVRLLTAGGATGTNHAALTVDWPGALGYATYGSSSDMWGTTLDRAAILDPSFGVTIQAVEASGTAVATASIDYVSVTVYYLAPNKGGFLDTTAGFHGNCWSIGGHTGVSPIGDLLHPRAAQVLPIGNAGGYGISVWLKAIHTGLGPFGNVVFDVVWNTGNTTGFTVPISSISFTWSEFNGTLAMPNELPVATAGEAATIGLAVRVRGSGMISTAKVWIDRIQIYPLDKPFESSVLRLSDPADPERFDGTSGYIYAGLGDGERLIAVSSLRTWLYMQKERSMHATQDDGTNPPSLWSVRTLDNTVGAGSPNAVSNTESFLAIAARSGAHIYSGGRPLKISREIQTTWDRINWAYAHTITTFVDCEKSVIYFLVPLDAATAPNAALTLDYVEGVGSEEEPGGRKWNIDVYPVTLNAAGILENAANREEIWAFGPKGYKFGTATNLDDTTPIHAFYETSYAKSSPIGTSLFGGVSYTLAGTGFLRSYLLGLGATVTAGSIVGGLGVRLPDRDIGDADNEDVEVYSNFEAERARLRFEVNGVDTDGVTGDSFQVRRVAVFSKPWAVQHPH